MPSIKKVLSAIDLLPIMLPVWVMAFGIACTILLLFGQLRNDYVIIFGGLALLVATLTLLKGYRGTPKPDKERNIWNSAVLVGVIVWGVFNSFYVSQHVITDRDPGVYTNAGAWLINHSSLKIGISNAISQTNGIFATSPGFAAHTAGGHTTLYAQGLHLLPIFLGLSGRLFGVGAMFYVNILFGVTALLAIYALGRNMVRPVWAAAITGALAASMPFIYFSRDNYSELLAATFTFGALTLFCLDLKSKKISLWFLTGLVAGAGALTRIDAFLVMASFEIVLILQLLLCASKDRLATLRRVISMVGGMALAGLIGWLDLSRLSTPYYQTQKTQFYEEICLVLFLALAGTVLISMTWRTDFLGWLDGRTKRWRAEAAFILSLLIALILVSRPLWLRAHNSLDQRSYAELSSEWISWYLGPPLSILGVAGIALTASRIVRKYNPVTTTVFIVFFITAAVYLVNPNIAPDQIWASRRMVPVIMPGIALFAAVVLDVLLKNFFKQVKWSSFYIAMAVVAIMLGPLITSRPLLLDHDTDLLSSINIVCANLPSKAAVLWLGTAGTFMVQPTDTICHHSAFGYGKFYSTIAPPQATLASAAQQAKAHGYVPIIGLFGSQQTKLLSSSDAANLTTIGLYDYNKLDTPVVNAPQHVNKIRDSLQLGLIESDGTIAPLSNT